MKKTYLFLIGVMSISWINAQDTINKKAALKKIESVKPSISKDTIQIVDTTKVIQSLGGELKTASITKTSVKDSIVYTIKDHPRLAELDSIWKQELYSTRLFDTINKTVRTLDYEPIEYDELSTDTLKARLKRLDARTPFNIEYNPALESVIKRYLKRRRKSLERLMAMKEFYFPLFEQELDNYDIPLEVKYLAIVESALKPRAKSRVGATGLWQFMYGTGKMFGLEVSSYVDERMDPVMATEAACKYLASLYKVFGDWDLALASYNSGPGNVTKAIRRSGGYTNYWNIRNNLPRETAGYLPAFLATMYIFEYAEEHGFKPEKPKFAYFETDTVRVKKMITLDQVSEVMQIDIEELQFLNPSYKLDIIPFIKDENYVLRLPLNKVGKFVTNEEQIYAIAQEEFDKREKPLPKFFEAQDRIRYRVRSGDYLGKIARRYGVRVSQIKRWNGLRSNNLKIGRRLTIYPRRPVTTRSKKKTIAKTSNKNYSGKTYTVRKGDTLWSIAKKFNGVTIDKLRQWNDIRSKGLKPGMKLKISKT